MYIYNHGMRTVTGLLLLFIENDNNNNIASTFVVCYCRAFCSASDVCGPTTLMAERQQNREVWSHKNFMRH